MSEEALRMQTPAARIRQHGQSQLAKRQYFTRQESVNILLNSMDEQRNAIDLIKMDIKPGRVSRSLESAVLGLLYSHDLLQKLAVRLPVT